MKRFSSPLVEMGFLFVGLWMASAWLFTPLQHGNDLWWHLATARSILLHHQIPRTDYFSWTMQGNSWIDHEWLFQLITFGFYQTFGPDGVILFKILLVDLTLLFVWLRLHDLPSRALRWTALAMVFWAAHHGWNERADLITGLGLSYLAWSTDELLDPRLNKAFLILPLVFAMWANMHGGFLIGLVALVYLTADRLLQRNSEAIPCAVWSAVCALATLLNPYGIHLILSLVSGVRQLQGGFISEWQPTPWAPMKWFWLALALFWFLFFMSRRFQWRSLLSGKILVAIFLSWSAVHYVRNTPAFLIVSFPQCAFWAYEIVRAHGISFSQIHDSVHEVSTVLALSLGLTFALVVTSRAHGGVAPQATPDDAYRFLDTLPPALRIYNEYSLGSYWLWYFGERRPDFIDGRFHTVHGFPELYNAIEFARRASPDTWETFLKQWSVEAAVVPYPNQSPYAAPFADYFPRSRWALVYWDDQVLVFVKRTAAVRAFISKNEFKVIEPEATPVWMVDRLRKSKLLQRQCRDDLHRNQLLHPESRRVQFWSSVADRAPVN